MGIADFWKRNNTHIDMDAGQAYNIGVPQGLDNSAMPLDMSQEPPMDGAAYFPGGMMPGGQLAYPEPTSYLKTLMRVDDYNDMLFHQIRGDMVHEQEGRQYWVPNPIQLGEPGGPPLSDAGIRIMISKVQQFISKYAMHSRLTEEQAHGYAYEASHEALVWQLTQGPRFQIIKDARSGFLLMVDGTVYLNLSRAIEGFEASRVAGMYQAKEFSGPMPQQNTAGLWDSIKRGNQ